jgi:hypothetical protein
MKKADKFFGNLVGLEEIEQRTMPYVSVRKMLYALVRNTPYFEKIE